MAYTSAPGNNAAYGRIKSAASTLFSDNQSLISVRIIPQFLKPSVNIRMIVNFKFFSGCELYQEIRKSMIMMKEIAVDMERDNESEMVTAETLVLCLNV